MRIAMRMLAFGTCTVALACVRATPLQGPDNSDHLLVECPGGQQECLTEASRRCPQGYDIVTHGTTVSGSQYGVGSRTELLIKCKAQPGDDETRTAPNKYVARPAPEGALGYRFRINAVAAEQKCEAQGYAAERRGHTVHCSGIPKALPLDGTIDLKFCEDDLCGVDVIAPLALDAAFHEIDQLRGRIATQYGDPTMIQRVIPPACAGTAILPCIVDHRAVVHHEWTWETGQQITLSLAHEQGRLVVKITYRVKAEETRELRNIEGL